MGKPSSPQAPDPYASAAAQYQYGTQGAAFNKALNSTDTVTPTGSTSYNVTGVDPLTGAPKYQETTTLSPAEQGLLTGTQQIQGGELAGAKPLLSQFDRAAASGAPGTPPVAYGPGATAPIQLNPDLSNVTPIPNTAGLESSAQATALAGEHASMDPALNAEREQLDASLRNSGNLPGSPAYETAMREYDARRANADTQAAGAAITAGTGLQQTNYAEGANTNQQLFGEDLAAAQARNTAENQQFQQGVTRAGLTNTGITQELQDYATRTGIPLQELLSLTAGTNINVPTAPGSPTASASTPDIMSAFQNRYQGELNNYNASVGTTNGLIGDAASLAALYFMGA